MAQSTCKHPDGCPRPARKLGWCTLHYGRIRDKGEPGPAARLNTDMRGKQCVVPDCVDPAAVKGMCRFHHDRQRRYGPEGLTEPRRRRHLPQIRDYTLSQRHRFYKYGLTPEDFDELLARQKGRCYICGTDEPTAKGWSVDHCHETNVVRFVACNPCNTALGLIKEDPAIAKRLYEVALECRQLRLV